MGFPHTRRRCALEKDKKRGDRSSVHMLDVLVVWVWWTEHDARNVGRPARVLCGKCWKGRLGGTREDSGGKGTMAGAGEGIRSTKLLLNDYCYSHSHSHSHSHLPSNSISTVIQ